MVYLKKQFGIVCLLCFYVLMSTNVKAQDIHFSQFWMNPIAINPAATGFYNGDLRLGIYNRSQWYTVTKAYQTNGLWFDMPIVKRPSHQDIFGFGMTFDFDRAGDSKYTTMQSNAFFSYTRALNRKNSHFLSFGISGGLAQRTINYASLSFDEQYQDDMYDQNNPITEDLNTTKFLFGDCAAGIQWFYQSKELSYYQAGFSMFHLNRPKQSLLKDKSIRMPIKYNLTFSTSIGLNPDMGLTPSLSFSYQEPYQALMIGLLYTYLISFDQYGNYNKFELGLDYRWNDAIYVVLGAEINRVRFNFSYDFNISKLLPASNAQGAVELSVYYIFKKKKKFKRQSVPCPIF